MTIISDLKSPDFKALLTYPKENIFEWIKVMGETSWTQNDNLFSGKVKYGKELYDVNLTFDDANHTILLEALNVANNPYFVSHLKRVINKVTYCVHCELCEVECPTGALSVVPIVKINNKNA